MNSSKRSAASPLLEQNAAKKIGAVPQSSLDFSNNFESCSIAEAEYEFIRKLVYEHSRINLGADKRVLVASRLSKRLRKLNLATFSQYCGLLKSAQGAEELSNLLDVISTNHTLFFRESKHFEFLRATALPQWTARLRGGREPMRVWSAACSSGEEPYTLAITLAEQLEPAMLPWTIDASDISTRVLAKAGQGIYPDDRLSEVSPELVKRYFQKGVGDWQGHCRVKAELREKVRFHHLNLLQPNYPFSYKFQIIFCRNVMIYFDRATQEALVAKLTQSLLPGGYLMVGHSESLSGIHHTLTAVQPAVYFKPLA